MHGAVQSKDVDAVSDRYPIPDPIIFSNNRTRPDFLRSLYDLTSFTWRYPRRGWWPPGLSEHLVQREEGGSPRVGVGVSSNIRLLIMLMILKLNIIQATSSLMKPMVLSDLSWVSALAILAVCLRPNPFEGFGIYLSFAKFKVCKLINWHDDDGWNIYISF